MTLPHTARVSDRARALLPAAVTDPLLRNGYLLTTSSGVTALVGLAYWAAAARRYDPATLGRNSAAISVMMFIAGVAELNLMSALTRFLPTAGKSTRSLVGAVYAASMGIALVIAGGFLALIGHVAPNLDFLVKTPGMAVWFVVSTMAWAIFVLQHSVLTGLRRTWLVPVENGGFALVKVALVLLLAGLLPGVGIFVSWTLAAALAIVPVTAFLFKGAIPNHERNATPDLQPVPTRDIIRFAATDYVGALFWLAALNLLPVLVISIVGAKDNAYFALAWVISYSIYLVSGNMGISLVVETAADGSRLRSQSRMVMVHTLKLVVPAVLFLVVVAPFLLRIFGSAYRLEGATLLRLLLLSAIPNVVTATAVSTARARRKTGLSTAILAVICSIVFVLSAFLLPVMGIVGVGVAWLAAQSLVAVALLLDQSLRIAGASRRRSWGTRATAVAVTGALRRINAFAPVLALGQRALGRTSAMTDEVFAPVLDARSGPMGRLGHLFPAGSRTEIRPLKTLSGLAVATVGAPGQQPSLVAKVARSSEAAGELRSHTISVWELGGDARLGEWRRLLPEIVSYDFDSTPAVVMERYVPGVDGQVLLASDRATSTRVLANALAAIADLHRRTARPARVGEELLQQWLDEPLATVSSLYRESSWQMSALQALGDELRGDLRDRTVSVRWTHGDYTPGNVRLAPDGSEVMSVLDWGGATSSGLAAFDSYLFLLASRMIRQRRELGRVVTEMMGLEDWSADERGMLGLEREPVAHRTLVLLCWLRHVASNLEKASYYHHHRFWRAANVEPVLQRLAR